MTDEVVQYFTSEEIHVALSIGGITYVDDWNTALAENPYELGRRAALIAQRMGVSTEIDYEENRSPDLEGLQQFINGYRGVIPFDPSGTDPYSRLTIDLAAGDRWLIDLTEHATRLWFDPATGPLDYANAMVPNRQPGSADDAIANWQEHIDGKPQYDPPILPLAPAKFTVALYLTTGKKPAPECVDYERSLTKATRDWVEGVLPHPDLVDASNGAMGYMFWSAGAPSTRKISTAPPNDCGGGMGIASGQLGVQVPMPNLRTY